MTPIFDDVAADYPGLWEDYRAREQDLEVVQLRRKPWWTRLADWVRS
ncbi:MAG TPA: hypothetical protein VK054_14130 [Beutenbergiaceae bacterium]|nr:hypothetical protein [Beutenbergiaceae bacterium]